MLMLMMRRARVTVPSPSFSSSFSCCAPGRVVVVLVVQAVAHQKVQVVAVLDGRVPAACAVHMAGHMLVLVGLVLRCAAATAAATLRKH